MPRLEKEDERSSFLGREAEEKWKRIIKEQCTGRGLYIWTILISLIVSRSVDYVLYVRLAMQMAKYVWFLGSVVLPIAFCTISWPVVWYKMWKTDEITPEMRAHPQLPYFIIGALDSLGVIISTIPAPYVSGPLQVVLSQFVIPVNMVGSFFFLKTRYRWTHMVGVVVIILGVVVALIPAFAPKLDEGEPEDEADGPTNGFFWIILLLVSSIPMAASNIYKEHRLKGFDLDVWFLNAWVATYQLIFGLFTAPLVFIQLFAGDVPAIKPEEMGIYLERAAKCFFGSSSQEGDLCGGVPWVFLVYIGFNMTFNISMLLVFKHGSATLVVVASAMRVALSAFGFMIGFIAGPAQRSLTIYDGMAVMILLFGIVMYRLKKEIVPGESDIIVLEDASDDDDDVREGSEHGPAPMAGESRSLGPLESGERDYAAL